MLTPPPVQTSYPQYQRSAREAMTDPKDLIVAWCKDQRQIMVNQVKMLKSGDRHIGGSDGMKLDDVTNYWIVENEQRIAEIDKLFKLLANMS